MAHKGMRVRAENFDSIQTAIDYVADRSGGIVEIAGCHLHENVVIRSGVMLRGGGSDASVGKISIDPDLQIENFTMIPGPDESLTQCLVREYLEKKYLLKEVKMEPAPKGDRINEW